MIDNFSLITKFTLKTGLFEIFKKLNILINCILYTVIIIILRNILVINYNLYPKVDKTFMLSKNR